VSLYSELSGFLAWTGRYSEIGITDGLRFRLRPVHWVQRTGSTVQRALSPLVKAAESEAYANAC
jgi:hypothetical protein